MRRLLLLRHAKTETDAPSGRDVDRRLDDRGRIDAAAIGAWLKARGPLPNLVCVSTAVRAQQTWELVAAEWTGVTPAPVVAHLDELYGAGPSELLAVIRAAAEQDPQQLMLVGHNPGLHEIALTLIGSGDARGRAILEGNLPTSGVVVIELPTDDWGDVAFRSGKLTALITPKILKDGT